MADKTQKDMIVDFRFKEGCYVEEETGIVIFLLEGRSSVG